MTPTQIHPTGRMSVRPLDDLILAVGMRAPPAELILWLERQLLALPAQENAVFLQVVVPSTESVPAVSDTSRRAMVHFAQSCQPRLRAAAFVLLLDGFLGSVVRSVLAAATMAAVVAAFPALV